MKIIISGVPCCGKTYFGDWLRDKHDFAHANLEARISEGQTIKSPDGKPELALWLHSLAKRVVVTWGFPPNQGCFDLMKAFAAAGFVPWWFYADFQIARSQYTHVHGLQKTKACFDPQATALKAESSRVRGFYGKRRIETLTNRGYLAVEEIFAVIAKG